MRKNCETCKHDDKDYPCYPFKQPCDECVYNDDVPNKWEAAEHYVPDTNADRIRAMSDEELAEFLCEINGCYQVNCPGKELCKFGDGKSNGLKKWLKQPAEVDNG